MEVGTKERGKIGKRIYKTVRGSRKRCIGHTKGGEVRIKRTVGLSGHICIRCSCAPSVILLMVVCEYAGRVGWAMWVRGPHQLRSHVVGGSHWCVCVDVCVARAGTCMHVDVGHVCVAFVVMMS
jgi:hypothetical protein